MSIATNQVNSSRPAAVANSSAPAQGTAFVGVTEDRIQAYLRIAERLANPNAGLDGNVEFRDPSTTNVQLPPVKFTVLQDPEAAQVSAVTKAQIKQDSVTQVGSSQILLQVLARARVI